MSSWWVFSYEYTWRWCHHIVHVNHSIKLNAFNYSKTHDWETLLLLLSKYGGYMSIFGNIKIIRNGLKSIYLRPRAIVCSRDKRSENIKRMHKLVEILWGRTKQLIYPYLSISAVLYWTIRIWTFSSFLFSCLITLLVFTSLAIVLCSLFPFTGLLVLEMGFTSLDLWHVSGWYLHLSLSLKTQFTDNWENRCFCDDLFLRNTEA